jgi:hypothetical protein
MKLYPCFEYNEIINTLLTFCDVFSLKVGVINSCGSLLYSKQKGTSIENGKTLRAEYFDGLLEILMRKMKRKQTNLTSIPLSNILGIYTINV